MKETLEAINQMQADGIIGKYAIGGAVGATFYLEPASTLDVDIFVTLPTVPGGLLLSLSPIYEYLKTKGGRLEDEHIVIGGWPLQFLPANNDLEREALAGRPKDHNRILQFIEQRAMDPKKLQLIVARHNLNSKWEQFERKFLEGKHG